jgi:hypothetical protein
MSKANKFETPLSPELYALCEAVFDYAYDVGFAARDRGFLDEDSRVIAQLTIERAIEFENNFNPPDDDYLLEQGEDSSYFVDDLYETYGTEEDKLPWQ